jgi:hypothetical protein
MEMIKLINAKGDIIERKKIDYEPNTKIWGQRGWKLYEEKAVTKPAKVEEVLVKKCQQTNQRKNQKRKLANGYNRIQRSKRRFAKNTTRHFRFRNS